MTRKQLQQQFDEALRQNVAAAIANAKRFLWISIPLQRQNGKPTGYDDVMTLIGLANSTLDEALRRLREMAPTFPAVEKQPRKKAVKRKRKAK